MTRNPIRWGSLGTQRRSLTLWWRKSPMRRTLRRTGASSCLCVTGGYILCKSLIFHALLSQGGSHQHWAQGMFESLGQTPQSPRSTCSDAGHHLAGRMCQQLRKILLAGGQFSDINQSICLRSTIQVASREFETDFRKLLGKSHPKVAEKLKAMLKR